MAPRLELTLLLFKPPRFSYFNDVFLILTKRNLHKKSSEALFIKIRSTPASLSYKGQVTMHKSVNGRLRFQAPLSSLLKKVPWLRLVACLLDYADSSKIIEGAGTTVFFFFFKSLLIPIHLSFTLRHFLTERLHTYKLLYYNVHSKA